MFSFVQHYTAWDSIVMACEDLAARSASAFTATAAEPQKFSSEKKQIGKLSECVTICLLSQEWGWDVVRLKDLKATCQTLLDKYEAILPAPTTAPRTTKPILVFISSVRSSNSHPDLLVTHHHHQPLFQITPVLNTGLSLSELLQLYKSHQLSDGTDLMKNGTIKMKNGTN